MQQTKRESTKLEQLDKYMYCKEGNVNDEKLRLFGALIRGKESIIKFLRRKGKTSGESADVSEVICIEDDDSSDASHNPSSSALSAADQVPEIGILLQLPTDIEHAGKLDR